MTQDEIIRSPIGREQLVALAREAGFTGCLLPEEADNLIGGVFINDENWAKPLERFAALVAAHFQKKLDYAHQTIFAFEQKLAVRGYENQIASLEQALSEAVLAEREACAQVCEDDMGWLDNGGGELCAKAIRRRGMDLLTQHSQAIGEYDDYPRSNS